MSYRAHLPALVVISLVAGTVAPAYGQGAANESWTPPRLADGQPDLNGTWDNVGRGAHPAAAPVRSGRQGAHTGGATGAPRRARTGAEGRDLAGLREQHRVGAYGNYWFDWFWKDAVAGDAPALLIEPADGRMPGMTAKAQASVEHYQVHLHDSYDTMESGDRCVSRGTYGMMMPTAYNNGKMFFHTADHVVILSEMIHNARIIPIDAGPHVDEKIKALFMTVWCPDSRSVESNCGIPRG